MRQLYKRTVTNGEEETLKLAARFAAQAPGGSVIALLGRMGAGKTAFARGFVGALGGEASSPTFTIVQEYDTQPKVVHFDLYKIESVDELQAIGYEEYFTPKTVVLMEWARDDALPKENLVLKFTVRSENEREIECIATGEAHAQLLERVDV